MLNTYLKAKYIKKGLSPHNPKSWKRSYLKAQRRDPKAGFNLRGKVWEKQARMSTFLSMWATITWRWPSSETRQQRDRCHSSSVLVQSAESWGMFLPVIRQKYTDCLLKVQPQCRYKMLNEKGSIPALRELIAHVGRGSYLGKHTSVCGYVMNMLDTVIRTVKGIINAKKIIRVII